MNAIPATATTGQETQGQHLAVVGGKSKPSKEAMEAKRAETKAKLEYWGLFQAAMDKRSKAFDSWTVADCDSAIAWAQKQIQKNGETPKSPEDRAGMMCDSCGVERAQHFIAGRPDPAEGMCLCTGCYRAATMIPDTMGPEGEGPWVDWLSVQFVLHPCECRWEEGRGVFALLELARSWDGFRGITRKVRMLQFALATAQAHILELEDELAESFGDIQKLATDREYKAGMKDILVVAGIDRGRLVRDLRKKMQQVVSDAVGRDDPAYKGKVKATLTISFDKSKGRPSEAMAAIITCEVNEDTPPAVCGSRLYFDRSGEIVPPKEAIEQMPLMHPGNESQVRA